ncbi:MAG: hypothetical protein ACOY5C_00800 [Pseudomonadota bacterium]|uniref:hypothetical protein n=1 Tax=Thermithiobacillus tepidarius TaxID=929 RepID=UPI0004262C32|nr:hypothetical protein [Thermithiobacillus tepidarius]
MDNLNYARLAVIDDNYIRRVETLVMGYADPTVMPHYADDWDDAEKLIARLAELGVGVRLEFVSAENGSMFRAYLDWQEPVSHEWQTVEIEEESAPRAVTRAALLWYYTQELASANAAPPDTWAYFEVVERVGLTRDLLVRSLEEHPVLQQEPELAALFLEIQEKLGVLFEQANQAMERQFESSGRPARGAMH